MVVGGGGPGGGFLYLSVGWVAVLSGGGFPFTRVVVELRKLNGSKRERVKS